MRVSCAVLAARRPGLWVFLLYKYQDLARLVQLLTTTDIH